MSGIGWDPRLTIFACHHHPAHRWISTCGWVEVCRACNECRSALKRNQFWPSATRREWRENGVMKSYGPNGEHMATRPIGKSVVSLPTKGES